MIREAFENINEANGWDNLEKELIKIIDKYNKEAVDDTSTPTSSGYGNSTARAIHKGNLSLAKQQMTGQSQYSYGTWWPIGIKVGTSFPTKIATKVYKDVKKLEKKYKNREIVVSYIIKEENGSKVLIARIDDGGKGFDTRNLRKLVISPQYFNGRGIMIIKKLLDRFYYNEKGNMITIRKFLN